MFFKNDLITMPVGKPKIHKTEEGNKVVKISEMKKGDYKKVPPVKPPKQQFKEEEKAKKANK